jgi:copper chaperone CopZ
MRLRLAIHLTFGTAAAPLAPLVIACAAPAADITTELQIGGMVCESCSQAITAALQQLEGVREVHVDHVSGKAVIRHDPNRRPRADLVAAVTRLGYSVAAP